MHAKKKECRDAHPTALQQFKQRLSGQTVQTQLLHPQQVSPEKNQITDTFDAVWMECKSNRYLQKNMMRLEDHMRKEFAEDSDNEGEYVFDAKEGVRTAIRFYSSLQKEVDELKARMAELEKQHNRDICDINGKLSQTSQKCSNMEYNYVKLHNEHSELQSHYIDLLDKMK